MPFENDSTISLTESRVENPGRTVGTQVEAWRATFTDPQASVAHLLCDRHDPRSIAFSFIESDLTYRDVTHGELTEDSRRFATALSDRGVGPGDSVAVLMGKRYELIISLLAIWRVGAVHVPLFTAFATPAIKMRVESSGAKLIITEPSQQDKVLPLTADTDLAALIAGPEMDHLMTTSEPFEDAAAVGGDGAMIRLFTSGTTGKPKAVPVPVRALAAITSYMHYGLDVKDSDVFWNSADPGWAYGLYYGIVGPLVTGRRNLLLNAGFTPQSTAAVMKKFGVTNFASAPTVYRSLSKKSEALDGITLRRASSAGEPLTSDIVTWSVGALGVEVRDHYGQTEHGMVIGNAWHEDVACPTRTGSMGKALPGFAAGVVDNSIALNTQDSPLMWFTGYVDAPAKTAERFTPARDWYLTGDSGRMDDDGYLYFSARDDDVILMAGYRIGPVDVESVLITHPAVVEVAVVGRPDELRGELLEAFVVLDEGSTGTPELEIELQERVRKGYSAHAYPRRVHFVDDLPKTPSGKIQRYLLRQVHN